MNTQKPIVKIIPQFSVLMSVYINDNHIKFIEAFNSICRNSLKPYEIILVVDGPVSEHMKQAIDSFSYLNNIVIKRLPNNVGLAKALNQGLALVKTEWVIRCDADDINHDNRFEKLMNEAYDVDIIGSSVIELDANGFKICKKTVPLTQTDIFVYLKYRNPFNHMSVAYRKLVVTDCGGYPEVFLKEDYALWALLIANGARVKNIDDPLVNVSAGTDMYARRGGLKNIISEIHLQIHLVNLNLKSYPEAFIHWCARSCVFILPIFMRKFIYEKFLRRKINLYE